MKKIILTVVSLLIVAGLAVGLYWWGNTPLKTYNPDGSLRSEVNRSFFLKEGLYTQYLPNDVRYEVFYKNGKKDGYGTVYSGSEIFMELPFRDGKKDGEIILFGVKTGFFAYDNTFKIESPIGTIEGRFLYDEEEFIERVSMAFPKGYERKSVNTWRTSEKQKAFLSMLEAALKCVSFEKMKFSSDEMPVEVTFDGAFTYPRFTKTSTFTIIDSNNLMEDFKNVDVDLPEGFEDYMQKFDFQRASIIIDENNKDVTLQLYGANAKPVSEIKFDLYDVSSVVSSIMSAASAQLQGNRTDSEKTLYNALRKTSVTKYEENPYGKNPDLVFNGRYNIPYEIEKESSLQIFNSKGKNVLKYEELENGFTLEAKYPISAKKLVNAKGTIKKSPFKTIQRMFTLSYFSFKNIGEELQKLEPNYSGEVEYFELFDINGKSLLRVKNLVFDVEKRQLKGEITFYAGQENEQVVTYTQLDGPVWVKTKDGQNKMMARAEMGSRIKEKIENEILENVWKPLKDEGIQFITERPATFSSLFIIGGMAGYTMAMNRYRANEILDYTARCISLAKGYNRVTIGACNQTDLLGYEQSRYKVEILSFSTPKTIAALISDLPRGVCRQLENRVRGSRSVTINSADCTDQYNDVIITFEN